MCTCFYLRAPTGCSVNGYTKKVLFGFKIQLHAHDAGDVGSLFSNEKAILIDLYCSHISTNTHTHAGTHTHTHTRTHTRTHIHIHTRAARAHTRKTAEEEERKKWARDVFATFATQTDRVYDVADLDRRTQNGSVCRRVLATFKQDEKWTEKQLCIFCFHPYQWGP